MLAEGSARMPSRVAGPRTRAVLKWCGRGDSNPYGITTASPSSWCVCQFRHFRVVCFEVPKLPTVANNSGALEAVQNPQYISASLKGTTDANDWNRRRQLVDANQLPRPDDGVDTPGI